MNHVQAGSHPIFVVDADEDDREFPECREVHALVQPSLLHRTIPKKGHGDLPGLLELMGKTCADNMGNASANNRVCSEMPQVPVGNVH